MDFKAEEKCRKTACMHENCLSVALDVQPVLLGKQELAAVEIGERKQEACNN